MTDPITAAREAHPITVSRPEMSGDLCVFIGPFKAVSIHYDYKYTCNADQWSLAECIASHLRRALAPAEGKGELAKALRELGEKATPAPWKTHLVDDMSVIDSDGGLVCDTDPKFGTDDDHDFSTDTDRKEADAALIVALRNALPEIIASLSACECAKLREERDKWKERAADRCDEAQRWAEKKWAEQTRAETAETSLASLRGEVERLTKERDEATRRRDFTEQWYAERLEPIKDVSKRVGVWPEVAAIIANGSGTRQFPDGSFHYEPPTYAQQLNTAKHRAEAAEARAEAAEARAASAMDEGLEMAAVGRDERAAYWKMCASAEGKLFRKWVDFMVLAEESVLAATAIRALIGKGGGE